VEVQIYTLNEGNHEVSGDEDTEERMVKYVEETKTTVTLKFCTRRIRPGPRTV